MCLHVLSGPHVATAAILIYKVLIKRPAMDDGLKNDPLLGESPFMNAKYYAHDLVTADFAVFADTPWRLKQLKPHEVRDFDPERDNWKVYEGLHGYVDYVMAVTGRRETRNGVIVPMVIPEGATYFLGHFGEVVADTLITSI